MATFLDHMNVMTSQTFSGCLAVCCPIITKFKGIFLCQGCKDDHITILVEFSVPAGKMDEFKAGFSKFYGAVKVF